jgi:hypothetical protein
MHNSSGSEGRMPTTKIDSLRAPAICCIVGAAATTLGGIAVQAIVQPGTHVSHDRWSYPWSSGALIAISLLWASLHVFVFCGVLGFARSGLAGTSRGARLGVWLALAGTALLFVGELASIPIRSQRIDDTGATIVGALFAVAILLTAVGFLLTGVKTLRARRWHGWGRFTPLSVGIAGCALLALNTTNALPAGVAVYGLCLVALGSAMYRESTPAPDTSALTAREQLA